MVWQSQTKHTDSEDADVKTLLAEWLFLLHFTINVIMMSNWLSWGEGQNDFQCVVKLSYPSVQFMVAQGRHFTFVEIQFIVCYISNYKTKVPPSWVCLFIQEFLDIYFKLCFCCFHGNKKKWTNNIDDKAFTYNNPLPLPWQQQLN